MNGPDADPAARARELRELFDRGFAVPRAASSAPTEDLLLALVNGRRYALRVAELCGVHPGRKITPLPSADPALLGIVGVRGRLIPAYGLAAQLGSAGGRNDCGWLVTCERSKVIVALAFDGFAGCVRVAASDLYVPAGPAEGLPDHIACVARLPDATTYVINTGSILQAITDASNRRGAAGDGGIKTHANATGR